MYAIEALQHYCLKRLMVSFEARMGNQSTQTSCDYALAIFQATDGEGYPFALLFFSPTRLSFLPSPPIVSSVDSAIKAICGIYLLRYLEDVLERYSSVLLHTLLFLLLFSLLYYLLLGASLNII